MARPLRIEYAGAVYHVMARGNQGQKICADDGDRKMWLATLEDALRRTGWAIHAWALMGNHHHLLLETPEPNLVLGMKWFQGTYTQRYNFGERLLARVKESLVGKRRETHAGAARQAHDGRQAERMLQRGLAVLGVGREELVSSPKGRLEKQVLAWWLYGRTVVTRRWIAENLKMGYETRVSQAVCWVQSSRLREVMEMRKKLMEQA